MHIVLICLNSSCGCPHINISVSTSTSVLFCSLAVLDPRVGHTIDVLSPLFLALSLSIGNSLVSSWYDHSMVASLFWQCLRVPSHLYWLHNVLHFPSARNSAIITSHFNRVVIYERSLGSPCHEVHIPCPGILVQRKTWCRALAGVVTVQWFMFTTLTMTLLQTRSMLL